MPITISAEISDELAERLDTVVRRTELDRDTCPRETIEFGIEDLEDRLEAAEVRDRIDAGIEVPVSDNSKVA